MTQLIVLRPHVLVVNLVNVAINIIIGGAPKPRSALVSLTFEWLGTATLKNNMLGPSERTDLMVLAIPFVLVTRFMCVLPLNRQCSLVSTGGLLLIIRTP